MKFTMYFEGGVGSWSHTVEGLTQPIDEYIAGYLASLGDPTAYCVRYDRGVARPALESVWAGLTGFERMRPKVVPVVVPDPRPELESVWSGLI